MVLAAWDNMVAVLEAHLLEVEFAEVDSP